VYEFLRNTIVRSTAVRQALDGCWTADRGGGRDMWRRHAEGKRCAWLTSRPSAWKWLQTCV